MLDPKEALVDPPIVTAGVKITEPGIYDTNMDWYHEDCAAGPSISASGINTLLEKTAKSFFYDSPYNPKRPEEEAEKPEQVGFRIGRGAHTLTFEPHLFAEHYAVRPERFKAWTTDASKEWRTQQQKKGITVFTPKEYDQVLGIVEALKEHPLYGQGLLSGYCERSLFWQDEETGVWLKSRPDVIPEHAAEIYANLKCLSQIEPRKVRRQVFDHGYHVQAALAAMGMEKILGLTFKEYALVCVGQKAPHDIWIASLDPKAIEWGRRLVRKGVRIFARCLAQNYWPSYDAQDTEYITPSDWLINSWATDPETK